MDKIMEKLAGVLSAEDLDEVKSAFETAVTDRLQVKLDEEKSNLAKKAEIFCQKRIKDAVDKKTLELENLANKYCEERCKKITEKAKEKLDAKINEIEEAAQQFVYQTLEEGYAERCGNDLKEFEESLIDSMDRFLEATISEKIGPELIKNAAINEASTRIMNIVQNAFADFWTPLDTTGSRQIKECKAENAQLRKDLELECKEVHRLNEMVDKAQKRALIAEKTNGLSSAQISRVKNMFESKSFASTKSDIDEYISVIKESASSMKKPVQRLHEAASFKSHSLNVDDTTESIITEKYQPKQKKMTQTDSLLLKAAHFSREN